MQTLTLLYPPISKNSTLSLISPSENQAVGMVPTFRSSEGRRLVLSSFSLSVVKEHAISGESKATGSSIHRLGQIPGLSCGAAAVACTAVVLCV